MKKHFIQLFVIFLCSMIILELSVPTAYAIDSNNDSIQQESSDISSEYNESEDSTFQLINSNIQISDDYENETDYISEIQISDPTIIDKKATITNNSSSRTTVGDPMVYLTQKWLNQEYGDVNGFGYVEEDGQTGWNTVYALLRALQHELGITSLANSFGPTTTSLYSQNLLYRQDGVTDRKFAILQGALWCKGYNPGYNLYETEDGTVVFEGVFDATVEQAVIELKEDAGFINPNGVVTVNLMKALMSMDSFKLLSSYGGTTEIRSMQQKLNRKYEAYTGLIPCDGVYGRNTNKALIYALQAEEGLPTSVANGNFGNTTKLCCPEIPYSKSLNAAKTYPGTSSSNYYNSTQIASITELLQFSLLVNGYDAGGIDGIFGSATQQAIRSYQKQMALPETGKADKTTWQSLFLSSGDTSRSALAADCATILTAEKAKTLYDNGYRYIGRYLTGTYNGGISKAITREEAEIIFDAGLHFFPIFQTSATYLDYFTPEQGIMDAKSATEASNKLGIPKNTIIYFAVDFDCLDYQITSNIIPYFEKVSAEMAGSGYRVGIYGTRNACSRVSNLGYACSSFVGDMSTGFSGNLGFSMPDNWAFDQFVTITIGSGAGRIEIDKDGFSGRDHGVSKLEPRIEEITKDDINIGSEESDTITGPKVNIMGYEVPLFELDIGLNVDDLIELDSEYDATEDKYKVLIGFKVSGMSSETTGGDTRIGKFNQAYREVKTTYSLLGKNPQEFSKRFKDFKGSLYQRGTKVGFDCESYFFGYMSIDGNTGQLSEGGAVMIATVSESISYQLVPCVYAKLTIEGSLETGFKLKVEKTGEIGLEGIAEINVTPKMSVGVDALLASAYAGIRGTLNCELEFPISSFEENFSAYFTAAVFFEYQALYWGNYYEWEFYNQKLYPSSNETSVMSINRNDLEFIEPLPQIYSSTYNSNPDILSPNVQIYCNPKIASLGNGKMILIYIADTSDRTAVNRSVLMYRIYDGNTWGEAQPILDDSTADFEPYIYADGNGGAHIIWQNCNTILDSDVTLEEMSGTMDLYYTYWNGTTFVNTTAITNNNSNYEMAHKVVASNNCISVVWQQNSENDPFALEGTNSIYRKQQVNGVWQNIETIASGLSVVTSLDASYINNNNVIAYTTKTNSNNTSDISDMEVFYYNGSEIIRMTDDSVADYSACLLNDELYWISGNSIVCITNGNAESKSTVVSDLKGNATRIKGLKNTNGKKSIIWQQESHSDVNFYGVSYNETLNSFGQIEPLSTDSGIIRGWDACLLPNGQIELTYGFAERLEESVNGKPYEQINLIQKTVNEICDISVNPIVTYTGNIEPNQEIELNINIYNKGSIDIEQFLVNIIDKDNTTILTQTLDYELPIGESGDLIIPFVLPTTITKTDYTIQIIPSEQTDVVLEDNNSKFTIGYADISIENIQESRNEDGRTLTVTIKNNGYSTVDTATLKFFRDTTERTLVSTKTISQLQPNGETTFTFNINSNEFDNTVSEKARTYYLLLETSEIESNGGNNSEFVYLYPDYSISLTAEDGGTVSGSGTYIKGTEVTLIATALPGYIFDGWYENGEMLHGVSDEYRITIDSNRNIEAHFKENDLQIVDIEVFGNCTTEETITFTANATGGKQPFQWEFYIQKDDNYVYSDNDSILNFFEWTPNTSGTYSIIAYVTDTTGKRVSYTTQITIN